jgi:L-cysteate sulfo-lyase
MNSTHGDLMHHELSILPHHLPRVPLAFLPTPLEELHNLRQFLGTDCPRLLIKRDDQTGLATGGNKVRKLEFAIGDALAQGADTVITTGAAQSNHCRQTAAAAAKLGLKCILLLRGNEPQNINGNLLLDKLLGADIRWSGKDQHAPGEMEAMLEAIALKAQERGHKTYIIPLGASNEIGAAGYIAAIEEAYTQLQQAHITVDRIIFLSGSGGTHAGMLLGAKLLNWSVKMEGILNSGFDTLPEIIHNLLQKTIDHYGFTVTITPDDIVLLADAGTHAYGVITDIEREAIRALAQSEGIIVDPVYTGRALAGLINRVRNKQYRPDETILFWHTGGITGLFARPADVLG